MFTKPYFSLEERFIISGLKKRDKAVFDFVFKYYYSGLCAYSMNYISSQQVAEDIVQGFFVSLWIKSENLEINTSLKSYLFTSVKNKCLDHLKHNKVKESYQKHLTNTPDQQEPSHLSMYVETELNEILASAIEKLSPRCREIFELSRFEGLKNAEIAEKLQISKRTVELQISNALKLLKEELKDILPYFIIPLLLQ